MRPRISIRGSVHLSVGQSLCQSIGQSRFRKKLRKQCISSRLFLQPIRNTDAPSLRKLCTKIKRPQCKGNVQYGCSTVAPYVRFSRLIVGKARGIYGNPSAMTLSWRYFNTLSCYLQSFKALHCLVSDLQQFATNRPNLLQIYFKQNWPF